INGPFFTERAISLHFGFRIAASLQIRNPNSEFRNLFRSSIFQNHPLRSLVASRLIAAGWYTPGRHRITTTGSFSFTATMRVIDRIHGHAAHVWANALPTGASGLTKRNVLVLDVANLPNRRPANQRHASHFT